MSPTLLFSLAGTARAPCSRDAGTARCSGGVPGVVEDGWVREGVLPGYYPGPTQDPIFNIFLRLSPTQGPVKANILDLMRFPR